MTDRSVGIDDTRGVRQSPRPRSRWTSAGSPSRPTSCCTCSARRPGAFLVHVGRLSFGAIGAVVLADTRRLADCFASIDYFEHHGTPFIIAVNCFDGAPRFEPDDIRIALSLGAEVPSLLCDARQRDSV